jgi:hypothetical protein
VFNANLLETTDSAVKGIRASERITVGSIYDLNWALMYALLR